MKIHYCLILVLILIFSSLCSSLSCNSLLIIPTTRSQSGILFKVKESILLLKINPVTDSLFFDQYNSVTGKNKSDFFLKSLENAKSKLTFCFKSSFIKMKEIIPKIKNMEGDIVEVGVWRGGLALYIQFLLIQYNINKQLYLYDTYSGFIKDDNNVNNVERRIRDYNVEPHLQFVKNRFRNNNLMKSNLKFIKGDIAITGTIIYPEKISLIYIDVDFYEPTYNTLKLLYPRVVSGGYIFIDDYGVDLFNCKKAVDTYLNENNIKVNLAPVNQFCHYFIKP